MTQQLPWDKYEAAILLDATIKVHQGTIDRKDAIADVSEKLRKRALLSGIEIDDVFRNIAGITFQMYSMESAYFGRTLVKPASKLFSEIVNIMNERKEEYDSILKEALNSVHDDSSYEKRFMSWLSTKLSSYKLLELQKAYDLINKYFLDRKVLKRSLFETTDKTTLGVIRLTIDSNRFFRFRYKKSINALSQAIRYYIIFLKELKDKTSQNQISSESLITESVEEREEETDQNNNNINKTDYETTWNNIVTPEQRQTAFNKWMIDNKVSIDAARLYGIRLNIVGEIAVKNGIITKNIYEISDTNTLKDAYSQLLLNPEFIELDKIRHSTLKKAWNYYINFSESNNYNYTVLSCDEKSNQDIKESDNDSSINSSTNKPEELHADDINEDILPLKSYNRDAIFRVLMVRYQNGMQLDSIDFDNFRDAYKDIIGDELSMSDEELERYLRQNCVMYKNRVFTAEGIITESAKEKLLKYIDSTFDSGKSVLYYKSIFEDLSDEFVYCFNLVDEVMLKSYLEYTFNSEEYYFYDDYMTNQKDVNINHSEEIVDYMRSAGRPLSYEEIYSGLSNISKEIIYSEIKTNPNILLNEREHYFHYDIFEFSLEDVDKVTDYIRFEIEEDGYSIWSHVYSKIKETMPLCIENNVYLSSVGMRNAVAKKMQGRFIFDGEVISNMGEHLKMSDVYRLYSKHHTPFTDQDLYDFSKEVNSGSVYFDAISEEAIRVSKELFVAKRDINFDVNAVDRSISTYLSSEYLPVKEIDSFLMFPNVGYEWNAYLLESYLMYFSKDFSLCNNGRSMNNVAGVVVSKNKGYDDFSDVCADILAESTEKLERNIALDYLVKNNILTKRSYSKIDEVLVKARQIRNKKDK